MAGVQFRRGERCFYLGRSSCTRRSPDGLNQKSFPHDAAVSPSKKLHAVKQTSALAAGIAVLAKPSRSTAQTSIEPKDFQNVPWLAPTVLMGIPASVFLVRFLIKRKQPGIALASRPSAPPPQHTLEVAHTNADRGTVAERRPHHQNARPNPVASQIKTMKIGDFELPIPHFVQVSQTLMAEVMPHIIDREVNGRRETFIDPGRAPYLENWCRERKTQWGYSSQIADSLNPRSTDFRFCPPALAVLMAHEEGRRLGLDNFIPLDTELESLREWLYPEPDSDIIQRTRLMLRAERDDLKKIRTEDPQTAKLLSGLIEICEEDGRRLSGPWASSFGDLGLSERIRRLSETGLVDPMRRVLIHLFLSSRQPEQVSRFWHQFSTDGFVLPRANGRNIASPSAATLVPDLLSEPGSPESHDDLHGALTLVPGLVAAPTLAAMPSDFAESDAFGAREIGLSMRDVFDADGKPDETPFQMNPGDEVGPYTIQKLLGAGGMGQVYLARHKTLERLAVIKTLLAVNVEEQISRRFINEARALGRLMHPHIVDVLGIEELDLQGQKIPYLIMEHIEGDSLRNIRKSKPFSKEEALELIISLSDALAYAHNLQIVHRDIKPDNVMIETRNGKSTPKLLDFGIAKILDEPGMTRPGMLLGTPHYMSPEQCAGQPATPKSDVYALGALFYFLLRGESPFKGNHLQVLVAHMDSPMPPLQSGDLRLDSFWEERMMAKDPSARLEMAQVAEEFMRFQKNCPRS